MQLSFYVSRQATQTMRNGILSTLAALLFCTFLPSCSSLPRSQDRKTIIFRARIVDVKQLSDGSTIYSLDVMHIGRETGNLVPGNVIQVHFTKFPKFYGTAWKREPQAALGFADNYMLDQSQDGLFTRLRFSPKGSPDVVLRPPTFFDFSHKIISIEQ